jgi:uncharacterized repeat protein (TIGR03803 family)
MRIVAQCTALVMVCCVFGLGQAQYKVLWNFGGSPNDGAIPLGNLVLDHAGNLYGTTNGGGSSIATPCFGGGCGTVFKLSPNPDGSWLNTILYSFCASYSNDSCVDGAYPQAGLVLDANGNIYGTTNLGGPGCPLHSNGCGTVFELSPPLFPSGAWTEKVLYAFCSNYVYNQCLDGNFPSSQLIFDSSGNLYGTTTAGGNGSGRFSGTVFELSPGENGWAETVLYSFCLLGEGTVCPDGAQPMAGVTFDKSGNLYGTTELGGSPKSEGGGTVYKLSPSPNGWTEKVLLAAQGYAKGVAPLGTVSFDALGNLYSTLSAGGLNGDGAVFRLALGGGHNQFWFNNKNGNMPMAGVLIDSKHASLYGTTYVGGAMSAGTVFKIAIPGGETVLYSFCTQANCMDGTGPTAGVIMDTHSGNLYGTTKLGGTSNLGVVFEILAQPSK